MTADEIYQETSFTTNSSPESNHSKTFLTRSFSSKSKQSTYSDKSSQRNFSVTETISESVEKEVDKQTFCVVKGHLGVNKSPLTVETERRDNDVNIKGNYKKVNTKKICNLKLE